jgi:phospholipid/cholesterol/gamma-HCH transport system substrate-binding protein
MNEQTMRFRVGIFALAALLLLAVLITLFGGFPTFFKRYDSYTVTFTSAPGVAAGTPVRRSGIRIGEVKSVELDNDSGIVRASIEVEPRFTLRKGDQATLVRGLLAGDTSIDFIPRQEKGVPVDLTPVPPGTTFQGVVQADVTGLINQTVRLVTPAEEVLKDIRSSLQRLDRMAPLAEDTLREIRDAAKAGRESIPDLRKTSDEIQVTARTFGKLGEQLDVFFRGNEEKLNKAIEALQDDLKRLGNVLSDENQQQLRVLLKNARIGSEYLPNIGKNADEILREGRGSLRQFNEVVKKADEVFSTMQQATKPWAERSRVILNNLDAATDKLNRSMTDLSELLRALSRTGGTFQRFLVDPSLYNHLDELASGLSHILPRLDRMMHDLEVFADKVARHPESLGLGGVFSPSSGLKEAPGSSSWKHSPGH